MNTVERVTTLHPSLIDRAVPTLVRAFAGDPMFVWMFPDPQERERALRVLNRVPLQYGIRYGRVTAVNGGDAMAIWIPPGRPITISGMIRSGMLAVPLRLGIRPFARFVRANDIMGGLQARSVPEPHWSLLIVAVDPDAQRRGLGSALVMEGLGCADADNCPCYLETSDERNVTFYERFGFTIAGTAALGEGGPPGGAMRREAAIAPAAAREVER